MIHFIQNLINHLPMPLLDHLPFLAPFMIGTISAGVPIVASDFVSTSSGSSDSGKVAKLNSNGKVDPSFILFGGTGADGALSISSGTTTIDLGNAAVVVKNYTSISITGTGALAFSNPHTRGTIIILRSQGNVTITTSATRAIDLRQIGSSTENSAVNAIGTYVRSGKTATGSGGSVTVAGLGGIGGGSILIGRGQINLAVGGSGSQGSNVGGGGPTYVSGSGGGSIKGDGNPGSSGGGVSGGVGAGGKGGGCLLIECGGAYNATGTLDASGQNGTASNTAAGGGGAGGEIVVVYKTLTANTATYTVTKGSGGTTSGGVAGADGADGDYLVVSNTELL